MTQSLIVPVLLIHPTSLYIVVGGHEKLNESSSTVHEGNLETRVLFMGCRNNNNLMIHHNMILYTKV